ncbi:MAG: FAD-dependent oxidoreductase [Synergistaceae bacterium]|nr:FAD-dependent oxidoreductase [Synergistaceae bacterium]
MKKQTYKNIIIGFGKAGRVLAAKLSQEGEESVIIERDRAMDGGTCPNVGCVPSKTLIAAGNRNLPFAEAMKLKYATREKMHNGATNGALSQPLVSYLNGLAKFISPDEVEVSAAAPDGTVTRLTGERIFINTGATPVIPGISGIHDSKNVITSESAMELDELPENLVIIGAGYIGLEFAGMFNHFGSKVTVLEPFDKFLPREDKDVADEVFKDLTESGISFHLNTPIDKISDNEVMAGGKVYTADKILVATGRKPNIDELNLSAAGIELQPNGYIKVDDTLKTTNDKVWALGDVRGGGQFYYLSTDDFRIVVSQLFGGFGDGGRKLTSPERQNVPYSVFITPTLSRVGLDERMAQGLGKKYRLFKLPAAKIVKANVLQDPRGLLKALVDPETDEILGATLYHEDSHEIINLVSLAMQARVKYMRLRDQIFTHPTMGEGLNDLFANSVMC